MLLEQDMKHPPRVGRVLVTFADLARKRGTKKSSHGQGKKLESCNRVSQNKTYVLVSQ